MNKFGYPNRVPREYNPYAISDIFRDIESGLNPTTRQGWADLLADVSAGRAIGANAPTWAAFRSGIYAYRFSASTMNEIWFSIHIPHDYAYKNNYHNGMVYPHVHWSTGSGTDTGVVRWGFEYSIAKGYSQEAFPASTTIYVEQAGSGVAYTHQIAEPAEGSGIYSTSIEPDSLILFRMFRDAANGNDTCTDTAFAFFTDLHYVSDRYDTTNRNVGSGWVKKY